MSTPKKRTQPTIRDVAMQAKVSVATASRALTNHPDVNPETRERVFQASRELGYRPSMVARGLLSGKTLTIGLLVSDITNPFYPELAKGIEETAGDVGYTVILTNTEDNPILTCKHMERLISQGVDGIIHASIGDDEEYLSIAREAGVPVVIANRRPWHTQNVDVVVADNVQGAKEAVTHLLSLGHRRIAHIGGPEKLAICEDRFEGYCRALEQWQVPFDPSLVSRGPFTFESGAARALELARHDPRPTAIFAHNDVVALGVLDTTLQIGLRVPRDIAVVGFDDTVFARHHSILLTSVWQDIREMGHRAMALLLDAIDHPDEHVPQTVTLGTQLVIRRTSSQTIDTEKFEN